MGSETAGVIEAISSDVEGFTVNTIGTAGSAEKCSLVIEHDYAQMINYRDEGFHGRVQLKARKTIGCTILP